MIARRSLLLLLLCCHCILPIVRSQPQLGVAIGNGNGPGGVVDNARRVHYEYNAPGGYDQQRAAGPFGGIVPGVILTFASSALQWWNEGRAVRDARMLSDATRHVVELEMDAPVDPKNEGNLVHVTGYVTTNDGLVDPVHGLHRPDALQLTRSTEAYQWKEQKSQTRTRVSERETRVEVEYHYRKSWTVRPIESERFESPTGHFNPHPKHRLGKDKLTARDARLSNGLYLEPQLVDQIGTPDFLLSLSAASSDYGRHGYSSPVSLGRGEDLPYDDDAAIVSSSALYFPAASTPSDLQALDGPGRSYIMDGSTDRNRMTVVRSMPRPEVGDVRVTWNEVTSPSDGVSVLAKQQGDKLVPWTHGNEGHTIHTLFPGKFSAKSMIEALVGRNKFVTKVLRIGGWLGSFLGLNMMLSCIPAIVGMVPFGVGQFLQPLAQIATSTIAMGASVGLSAAVVAAAWVRFRPLLAAGLALVSGAGFFGPLWYARAKRGPEVKDMDAKLRGAGE